MSSFLPSLARTGAGGRALVTGLRRFRSSALTSGPALQLVEGRTQDRKDGEVLGAARLLLRLDQRGQAQDADRQPAGQVHLHRSFEQLLVGHALADGPEAI